MAANQGAEGSLVLDPGELYAFPGCRRVEGEMFKKSRR
jgi:hypothetical protein